ncbi:NAD(P)-binding protein [Thozetella sp. PMI_491]|nr:NAD(P)-binding protein [Thozetella sp. PMI_491]
MTNPVTIVFGPTGNVGSAAALRAHELGSKVILALRDTQKAIPGLSPKQEAEGAFERVQADLTDPKTIEAAVQKTRATNAFIYFAHTTTDHMRSTIEALKMGGITFVVFLGTLAVQGDRRNISPAEWIPYVHAQVELNLEEVFGPAGYVAIRPAFFASNASFWKTGIVQGSVEVAYPDALVDWISPEDIGKVAGTVLVRGIEATKGTDDPNVVFLLGPKLVSLRDGLAIIGKVLGKHIEVVEVGEDEGSEAMVSNGVPAAAVPTIMKALAERAGGGEPIGIYAGQAYTDSVENVTRYAGRATSLEEWAEKNKASLQSP